MLEDTNMLLVSFSRKNLIISMPYGEFNLGEKAGKGVNLSNLISREDMIMDVFATPSSSDLLIISSVGKIYRISANQLLKPVKENLSEENKLLQVQSVRELLSLDESSFGNDERIIKIIHVQKIDYSDNSFLFLSSKDGMIKKIKLSTFANASKSGSIVMTLQDKDEIASAIVIGMDDEVLLSSSLGRVVRFKSADLRDTGKSAMGVKGIKLINSKGVKEGELIDAYSSVEGKEVFVLTDFGKAKWVHVEHFRLTARGSAGVLSQKGYGDMIFGFTININNSLEEIFILTNHGKVGRIPVNAVSQRKGRVTAGVAIMKIDHKEGEKIIHCFKFQRVKQ